MGWVWDAVCFEQTTYGMGLGCCKDEAFTPDNPMFFSPSPRNAHGYNLDLRPKGGRDVSDKSSTNQQRIRNRSC
jgi:hypothetical protein